MVRFSRRPYRTYLPNVLPISDFFATKIPMQKSTNKQNKSREAGVIDLTFISDKLRPAGPEEHPPPLSQWMTDDLKHKPSP